MFSRLLILLIRSYQLLISPLFPGTCRFYPSCSNYSIQSINRYGLLRGILLTLKRVVKCHPWNPGGYDPVV